MRSTGPVRSLVESLGAATLGLFGFLGGAGLMLRDTLRFALVDSWRGRGVPMRSFWHQAVRSGPKALGVVLLVNFFVGLILALIGGKILIVLGFKEYVGRLMGIGMVLELGPLLTGIIVTGYIGAAYTAEIASMRVSEELTALETMAINPVRFIAAPRLLAVVLMVPCITLLGDVVGLYGGLLVADNVLGVGTGTYFDQAWIQLNTLDVWRGTIKSVVFGLIIGLVGCYKGFRASGGAEGVGRATTSSVVTSIVGIIVSDAILNYLLLFRL